MPEDRDDFVRRLRIRWDAMGDMANNERSAAAAEIEYLRRSQRELMAKVAALTAERDEARREVCRDEASRPSPSPPCTATQAAARRGWDCFEEPTP